jgi:hypothetical protein
MPHASAVSSRDAVPLDGSSVSRRALFAAAGGLAGAAAVAPAVSLAQTAQTAASAQATPQMPPVQAPVRPDWLARRTEEIIEPDLPIIDPHHHLWDARATATCSRNCSPILAPATTLP